jgi:hypothetical protein
MATPDEEAAAKVDAFEKDTSVASGRWIQIPKADLVRDLRARLADKDGVNQQGTGFCGPAAVVHCLLQDSPAAFVELVLSLYKTAQAAWKGMVVQPDWYMLAMPPPDGTYSNGAPRVLNRADWIAMASIRNSIDPLKYYGNYEGKGSGVYADDLEAFLRKVGYTKIEADYNMNSISAGVRNAEIASDWFDKGYRVILNINSNMLHADDQEDHGLFSKPNHYVQLVTAIRMFTLPHFDDEEWAWKGRFDPYHWDDSLVIFKVFTWGQGHRTVPEDPNRPLTVHHFRQNYYGYIAFRD